MTTYVVEIDDKFVLIKAYSDGYTEAIASLPWAAYFHGDIETALKRQVDRRCNLYDQPHDKLAIKAKHRAHRDDAEWLHWYKMYLYS